MAVDPDYIAEFHDNRYYPDGLIEDNVQYLSNLLETHERLINELSPPDDKGEFGTLLHRAVTQAFHCGTYPIRNDCDYPPQPLKKVSILLGVNGINVNLRDNFGRTPLMATWSVKCVELLLAHPGININAVDHEGRTALWHAAALGGGDFTRRYIKKNYSEADALQIAHLLITAGADGAIADESGRKPLDVAKMNNFTSYEKLITHLDQSHYITQTNGLQQMAKRKVLETLKKYPDYYNMSRSDKQSFRFHLLDPELMKNSSPAKKRPTKKRPPSKKPPSKKSPSKKSPSKKH